MLKNFACLAVLLILFSSCQTESKVDVSKEIEAIKLVSKAFSQAYVDGDLEKQMGFYTDDVVNIVGGNRIIEGKQAVTNYWTRPESSVVLEHSTTPNQIVVEGNTAFDYGVYQGKSLRNKDTTSFSGQYLITWRKVDGEWKMSSDMWASKN